MQTMDHQLKRKVSPELTCVVLACQHHEPHVMALH